MLRRARVLLPLLTAAAAALGGLLGDRWPWAVVLGALIALAVVARLDRVARAAAARRDEEAERVLRERLEAMRSEQERVVRLLEALPTAVLLFGHEGLVYANPTALELFELDGAPGLSPIRALGVAGLAAAVAEAAEAEGAVGGGGAEPVTVGVTRDDRELVGRATATGPGEVALIVTDLTSLQRVEAMRRDFVANASHELKTPVTGMRALADSLHLALDRDPDRARSMVERIQAEAARMAQLVRDLLDLARLEEGHDGRAPQRVDLAELCAQQVERLRPLAEEAEVDLQLTGGDASVIGISDDLKLVVGNLVHNAIQYNRPGGTVTVHVGRGEGTAVVQVADDGIGIPETDQERVFERFYRVDKARSRAAGGTGLGLSLIRHAVQRHGGEVRVASVLGEGSTFTVELPVDGGAAG